MKTTIALSIINIALTGSIIVGGLIIGLKAKKKFAELETKMSRMETKGQKSFGKLKAAFEALED